jgi:hypothetical protein
MGVSVAPGHNAFSGIYIPEVWSGRLLEKFYKATVFGEIANTWYEGDISSMGDKVHIRDTPDITISDYSKGQNLNYEHVVATDTELDIDKAKYWAFISEDVDEKQSDINYVEDWTQDAAKQLAINIDSDILANIYSSAASANQGATAGANSSSFNLGVSGTPLQLTSSNIIDFIMDCGTVLDEQNAPEDDRFLVLPPVFCNLIKKSDLGEVQISGDDTTLRRHGVLGTIDRFTIYRSNQLDTTVDGANTVYNVIAGQKSALTFASQLTKNDSMRSENTFGQLYRGLQVYGYKVIKPEALVWGYVYK